MLDGGGIRFNVVNATFLWNKIQSSSQHDDVVIEPTHVHGCIKALYMTPTGLFVICMPRAMTKTYFYDVVFAEKSLNP